MEHQAAQSAADVQAAVQFIIRSIEEQSIRSGTPIDEQTRQLLLHLPRYSIAGDVKESVLPDTKFDALCKLTGEAHSFDVSINSRAEDAWRFAYASFRMVEHPYLQLLRAAGFEDPPSTDVLVSSGTSALFTFVLYVLIGRFDLGIVRVPICLICFGLLMMTFLRLSRDAQNRRLARNVEEARGKLPLNFKFE